MTPTPQDWDDWREAWREHPQSVPPMALDRWRRERRRMAAADLGVAALVLAASAGIAAALVHTPSGFDAAWGATILGLLWLAAGVRFAVRPDGTASLAEPTETFLALARRRCRRQLRAVRFAWVLLGLVLLFFVPWWADGLRWHAHELGSPLAIAGWWLPAAALAGLAAWSVRRWRRLAAERERIEELAARQREA